SNAWRARDIVWDRLACDPLPDTHPMLKLIPKSDVLVKKVVVRRNIASAKRNGPRWSSWRSLPDQESGLPWSPLFTPVNQSGHPRETPIAPKSSGDCNPEATS